MRYLKDTHTMPLVLLQELGISYTAPSCLWSDNKSIIDSRNIQSKFYDVGFVPKEEQIAHIFTKPLSEATFTRPCQRLRLAGCCEGCISLCLYTYMIHTQANQIKSFHKQLLIKIAQQTH